MLSHTDEYSLSQCCCCILTQLLEDSGRGPCPCFWPDPLTIGLQPHGWPLGSPTTNTYNFMSSSSFCYCTKLSCRRGSVHKGKCFRNINFKRGFSHQNVVSDRSVVSGIRGLHFAVIRRHLILLWIKIKEVSDFGMQSGFLNKRICLLLNV